MSIFSEEDKEILLDFINESNEALEKTEQILLQLEDNISKKEQIDSSLINTIFRTFHSIKGSAGFIGLNRTNTLTHHAETLLDNIRKGKISMSKDHVDIFLEVSDTLQMLLDHIFEKLSEDGFEGDITDLEDRLKKKVDSNGTEDGAPAGKTSETKKEKVAQKSDDEEEQPKAEEEKQVSLEALITPEMVNQFIVDANDLIDSLEQDLLELEKSSENNEVVQNVFRSLHSLKGNAGLFNYTDINTICHKAESFFDKVRMGEAQAGSNQISMILQVLDFLRGAVEKLTQGKDPVIAGKVGLMDLMDDVLMINENVEDSGRETPQKAIETDTEAEVKKEDEPEKKKNKEKQEKNQEEKEKEEEEGKKEEKKETAVKADNQRPAGREERAGGDKPNKGGSEVIRVDVERLNKLMDLVGEIVIAESMVSHNPDLAGKNFENFDKAASYLQKNIKELQDLATSMRMVPLTGLFSKMRRLVRDISAKKKNQVELVITGGETEVDRSVIEHISDPLVHILRNSIDHGIEYPEERKKKGKNPAGTIELKAERVGGEIWITIIDDGAGLNKDKIVEKAKEKGLISDSDKDLTDQKICNLIFTPGFSTASQVTNLSGRGVGMDVALRNIEKIRGRIDVQSEQNQGTTINLKIPLTTAIIDGMLMRVNSWIYAIPTLDIKESIQVNQSNVVNLTDGQEVINVRDKLLPVLRLHELHQIKEERKSLDEGIVVVTESGNSGGVGFLVEEIIGQQQLVIKPLPQYVGDLEGVSGCAVLGNGDICLILDLASLVKMVQSSVNN